MPVTLDSLSKVVTIVSAGIAVFAAWIALPLDAELKRLQTQTQKLDIDLKAAEGRLKETEARLKETESGRKLSFDLYKEVRNILERKDKTPKDEEALRVLIESLADDPFRYKLLGVLAVSASTPEVKRAATESSSFFREEAQVVAQKAPVPPVPGELAVRSTAVGSMDVDVFYCAARQATSEPVARSVLALRQSGESGRWRLRFLPDSVNQQPGYGITSNEIRYNVPDETEAAKLLAERIGKTGLKMALRESQQPTRWYISVFICQ
ncbi:hypothetical protein HZU83_02510 [Sphaerotilus montanus]|uniref:Uncharacterized protein n=1 Tax=Sphaerotilus montanus TaxID=522889 RepID=A0A7Y9R0D0_9BURK|nr:hypothetical protein [Sphaerotilus montanus]NYG34855.1 hypothetical protein [Sphaerotilus montanus]NZD55549.1 hypothetical protein [Sphaerotilus montanus]